VSAARTSLVAALCLATPFMAACHQKREALTGSAVPSPRPVSLVAALGGRLAVLGSADGSTSYVALPMIGLGRSRGSASDVPRQFTNVSSIAVTADGRSVIVTNGARDCRTEGGWEKGSYQPEIDRVVIETGARERVVGGADSPVVNAKGIVAYGIVCDGQGLLGFTDLVTGQNARRDAFDRDALDAPAPESSPTIESVRPLAWLRDERTLFYEVSIPGEGHPRYYFGRVWPLALSNEQVVVRVGAALHEAGLDPTAAALVADKTVAFAQDSSAGTRVREWDVSTESVLRADWGFQLPETITALTADPSGTHFLAVSRSHVLYRWSVGDTAPTKLADGVSTAVWLP
jgi:hypothetical protein